MNYKQQLIEIKVLTRSIRKKANNFIRHVEYPYQDDLLSVIKDLKEVDDFLK